jgi:hypothetical protein
MNGNQKYLFTIEIKNTSGSTLILKSYQRGIKYDSITILNDKIFKTEIRYGNLDWEQTSNYQIWSDNLNGNRDKIVLVFNDGKMLDTQGDDRYNWLYINHATKKPRRGFSWFNPDTNTWNYGTFKYCITKEDYEKAVPI